MGAVVVLDGGNTKTLEPSRDETRLKNIRLHE